MEPLLAFVSQIVQRFPAVRSIWLMGPAATAAAPSGAAPAPVAWNLVAFATPFTAQRVRKATDLHRSDVVLRVVTDGDRFEIAWGALRGFGSLMSLDWIQASSAEAHYNETSWEGAAKKREVRRTRRKAVRLWPAGGLG